MLMTIIMLTMTLIIVVMLAVLIRSTNQYNLIVQNLVTASEFNFDFKETLDYKMYQYVIGGGDDFDTLDPLSDVDNALNVVEKLKLTTVRADNIKRLQTISAFLMNLRTKIEKIHETHSYQENMTSVDYDIRVLTELIQEKVQEYIFYETNELAVIRERTNQEITRTIVILGIVSIAVVILLWVFSFRISDSIVRPIRMLSENFKMVGRGDFTVRSEKGYDDEIQMLNDTFDSMVGQIEILLNDVKHEQENLRQTELKLLQAQINPHFLYNTFDTIIYLAEDHQDEKVIEMITSLSVFFRTTLSKGEDIISLREEEVHACSYLEIQKVRYRDILEYEIVIPEELLDYSVPKLTLQPLVENALYHGIKNKRGMGKITVKAWQSQCELFLQVKDNGIGMKQENLEKLRKSVLEEHKIGFGLSNVHERIQLYYGSEYGLSIESEYDLGTEVTIKLPLNLIRSEEQKI
mgnify:FL=1